MVRKYNAILYKYNAIHLREIQTQIVEDQVVFQGIDRISISTIDRIIQRNQIRTKQLYRVPYERNSIELRSNDSNMCRELIYSTEFLQCIEYGLSLLHINTVLYLYCNILFVLFFLLL